MNSMDLKNTIFLKTIHRTLFGVRPHVTDQLGCGELRGEIGSTDTKGATGDIQGATGDTQTSTISKLLKLLCI